MYVLPPKACTTCPWLPLIWNPRGTPASGSSNSRLSPRLRSEQRRNIYFLLLNALIKELILYNAGKYRVSQKKLLKNVGREIIPKAGTVGTSFLMDMTLVHLITLALIKKWPKKYASIRWSLWAYSAVVVLDDIEVCSNSQGGGGGGGGHIMKLLSLTFVKKFRTACHDVANIFRWQMLKATSTIDPRFQRTTVPPLSTS